MKNQTQRNTRLLPHQLMDLVDNGLNSFADILVKLNIKPNLLTLLALFSGLGAGCFFYFKQPLWAAFSIIICGSLDILDGKVAFKSNNTSQFGAIFDSTMDRYSEFFIYFGLALYFRNHWAVWLIFFTILGSNMVSYTRARAEGLGIECSIGIMQRAERMIYTALGTFIGVIFNMFDTIMIITMGAIALISNFTALQRTFYVKKIENQNK